MDPRRAVLCALVVAATAMSGCTDDSLSQAEMASRVQAALQALPQDVGPGGVFASASVQAQLPHLDDWVDGTADTTFNPDFDILFGPDDDLLGSMSFFGVSVEFYCHPDAVGIVTDGMDGFGAEDLSFEQRNPAGACLDLSLEQAVEAYGDEAGQVFAYLVDPTTLLAVPQSLEQIGKDVHATFDVPQALVKVIVAGEHVRQLVIEVEEPEGRFVINFKQGDRAPLELPTPAERLASVVTGLSADGDFGYRWLGESGGTQSVADYEVRIYDTSATVRCGGMPEDLVATFDLGDGDQTIAGFRLTLAESGDGKLGDGDLIEIQHPDLSKDWEHKAVIWDSWADRSAHRLCQ